MLMNEMKKQSATQNVKEALEKAHAVQDALNGMVTFVEPTEEQINQAQNGKMAGIPIVIKDNVNTKGIRTTASSKILNNYVPVYNAHIVELLEKEGALLIGKSSMDELAMGGTNKTAYTGPVLNPYDTTRISGGSSGGSAVLVASGVVPMAIGSDTGDSVRKPASFCGIVGVKPTYGRISRYGVIPYASSLDHVAYFTRSVEDAATTLEVLAGRDDRDMTSSYEPVLEWSKLLNSNIEGKRIGIFKNVVDAIDNQETVRQFNELCAQLEKRGATLVEVDYRQDLMKVILPTYYLIANCEATANHSNLDGIRFGLQKEAPTSEEVMIQSRTEGFGSNIKRRFVIGSMGLFAENQEKLFKKAQRVRRLIVDEVARSFENIDCLLAPASGNIAPKLDEVQEDTLSDNYMIAENHMAIGNFTGYPSMTVPMSFQQGCPIGLNLTCRAFDEETMFNIASAIEECTGLKDKIAEVK